MISVEEALRRITGAFRPLAVETVGLGEALGRVLAEDVVARVTQPPAAVSAMDGYAVRAVDVAEVPVVLTEVGEAPCRGQPGDSATHHQDAFVDGFFGLKRLRRFHLLELGNVHAEIILR